ncbi:MAG: hypothetical protein RI936_36 [Pseudomonadota bacterium]|jgi:hypothetical protein
MTEPLTLTDDERAMVLAYRAVIAADDRDVVSPHDVLDLVRAWRDLESLRREIEDAEVEGT